MFNEELKSITAAEERAEQIKKDARAEAKTMIDQANAKAQTIVADAESKAKERYDSLKEQGLESANGKYQQAIHEAEQQAADLAQAARARQSEAISYIKKGIGANVNS